VAPSVIPEEIDYEEHVLPIFIAHCDGGECHGPDSSFVDLSSPGSDVNIVGVESFIGMEFVVAGDPGASYLWHRLLGTGGQVGGVAALMPPADGPLCGEELALIHAWILGL
jgi:hypothetical protein